MPFLRPARKETAFAKIGFLGFAGAGKTYTATDIAIGLQKMIKSQKPIAFLDTETGSDYIIPLIEKAGYKLIVAKTRAFKDLLEIVKEAEQQSDILIIDSVSHIWTDLLESYLKRKNRDKLSFQDWAVIKPTWRKFTDLYLTSKIHIIICGRAAFEWDYFENEDGKMELHKSGVKMRAETEFGYEPSLLIEMIKEKKDGGKLIHRADVIKDRAQLLDGKSFNNPTFENFKPHFQVLSIGGEHQVIDITRTSEDMFEKDTGKPEWKIHKEQISIALEELDAELTKSFASSSKDDKKNRITICEYLFNTSAKTRIENMKLFELQGAVEELKKLNADTGYMDKIIKKELVHEDYIKHSGEGKKKEQPSLSVIEKCHQCEKNESCMMTPEQRKLCKEKE